MANTCADYYGKLTCANTLRLLGCTCSECCSDISGAQLPPEPEPETSPSPSPVPPPATDCYTGDGALYRGDEAKSNWGSTCQKWSSQIPNAHAYDPKHSSNLGKGLGDHNKCRNPDSVRARPWCYTTNG